MPPVRTNTVSSTIRPVKTERTHEENQERAYIAASRRSDRSLEARVESARRASEIHKKRTGRSLRVTEKDVINEEMYEEEDDNLPAQYARLTAHLHTHSLGFNRRLHAYIQSHAGTRNAMALQNAPFSYQMMQPIVPPQVLPPQMYQQAQQNYRHAPYPMSPTIQSHPQHHRSASITTTQDPTSQSHYLATSGPANSRPSEHRRKSMPPKVTQSPSNSEPEDQKRQVVARTSTNIHNLKLSSPGGLASTPSYVNIPVSQQASQLPGSQQASFCGMPFEFNTASQHINMNSFDPLTMTLPMESQQFFGTGFGSDLSNPYGSMLMNGSQQTQQPFYSYNPNPSSKSSPTATTKTRMNQTLAPSYNDLSSQPPNSSDPYSSTVTKVEALDTPFNTNYGYASDSNFVENQSAVMRRNNNAQGSPGTGNVTPGEWSNFIEPAMLETPSQ